MAGLAHCSNGRSNSFQRVVDAFLSQPGLPFANVLSTERIERIFTRHRNLFGVGAIYSTAVTILSLATACVMDVAIGPSAGKETGETALLHGKQPRQISFASACQYVLSSWMLMSCGLIDARTVVAYCAGLLQQIASCEVANRPDRLEPRVLNRRRHRYKLMQKPRNVLRRELRKECT